MARGAQRACALFVIAAGAAAMMLTGAAAQTRQNRSLTQVERDRGAATAEAARLRDQAARTRTEIAALNERLVEAGERRAAAEAAAADAETRLSALRLRAIAEGAAHDRARDAFESAVITAAIANRRGSRAASRAGVMSAAAAPTLAATVQQRRNAVQEAQRLNEAIAEEQLALADAQEAIDAERADVMALMVQRRAAEATLTADAAAA